MNTSSPLAALVVAVGLLASVTAYAAPAQVNGWSTSDCSPSLGARTSAPEVALTARLDDRTHTQRDVVSFHVHASAAGCRSQILEVTSHDDVVGAVRCTSPAVQVQMVRATSPWTERTTSATDLDGAVFAVPESRAALFPSVRFAVTAPAGHSARCSLALAATASPASRALVVSVSDGAPLALSH